MYLVFTRMDTHIVAMGSPKRERRMINYKGSRMINYKGSRTLQHRGGFLNTLRWGEETSLLILSLRYMNSGM